MKINKILLVGGTGYIGRALYEKLATQYTIHFTGRNSTAKNESDFKQMDFSDEKSIERALEESYDLIIILAATIMIQASNSINLDDELFNNNLYGLNKFMNYIPVLQKHAALIYTSSMTVYGENAGVPVAEDARLHPLHGYGLSKIFAEQILSYYISHNLNSGVVIRIPGVYGGNRKDGYIYNVIKKLMKSEDICLDTTNLGYWETIQLDDLVEMFAEFIQHYDYKSKFEIFNMSYGEETDFIDTAYRIRAIMGLRNNITQQNKDYKKFYLDNKKISKYVSVDKYSYMKSLERYCSSFR